ncbi:hypothetical protein F5148DRAFT_1369293 [Russula earlei]|uniref:Uncharacterized protein n=1 Tax=Russula earlei TaxID=71964 RepID=A0ACC0U2Q0_9AGAM|nr:hypothetical protein F5148DRAFT_1369293 [Russula earlei]
MTLVEGVGGGVTDFGKPFCARDSCSEPCGKLRAAVARMQVPVAGDADAVHFTPTPSALDVDQLLLRRLLGLRDCPAGWREEVNVGVGLRAKAPPCAMLASGQSVQRWRVRPDRIGFWRRRREAKAREGNRGVTSHAGVCSGAGVGGRGVTLCGWRDSGALGGRAVGTSRASSRDEPGEEARGGGSGSGSGGKRKGDWGSMRRQHRRAASAIIMMQTIIQLIQDWNLSLSDRGDTGYRRSFYIFHPTASSKFTIAHIIPMRISFVFATFCLAIGVTPSFALPSSSIRINPQQRSRNELPPLPSDPGRRRFRTKSTPEGKVYSEEEWPENPPSRPAQNIQEGQT